MADSVDGAATVSRPMAMSKPLAGVTVVEVAGFYLVPSAAAVLADWGAEVIKIEHPVYGDPARGLVTGPITPGFVTNINWLVHSTNRSKKSVGLDIAKPAGREILLKLAERADVFMTNLLPSSRARLGIDLEEIRAVNPTIVYARGSGMGPRGKERERGGFDWATFWARGGIADMYHVPDLEYPPPPNGGFGDLITGAVLAGAISAGLVARARGEVPGVVDVSLLGVASWLLSRELSAAAADQDAVMLPKIPRSAALNPMANTYRTKDGRFLVIVGLQPDRYWPELCARLGKPELQHHPQLATASDRLANRELCVKELDQLFAQHTLAEWTELLDGMEMVWEPVRTPSEMILDEQMLANDYLVDVVEPGAGPPRLVAAPGQFDETSNQPERTPEHAEHTELVLLDMGFTWDELTELKEQGAIR